MKFGCNRPIVSIDGYDETVHDGPFQLSRNRQIEDERPGWSDETLLKNALI